MSNRKTIGQRILHAAAKENQITTSTLRRRMRIPTTEMDQEAFNNSVMRTARSLYENGLLKRTDRGTYCISKKGMKAVQ